MWKENATSNDIDAPAWILSVEVEADLKPPIDNCLTSNVRAGFRWLISLRAFYTLCPEGAPQVSGPLKVAREM